MNQTNLKFASQLINPSYATLGYNSIQKRTKIFRQLLTQHQLPDQGLDQLTLNYLMDELALMDSNNFYQKIGVGQRQSRIFCPMVLKRNFYMGHGIGRSGDIMANQPKAAGSSLLLQLARFLTISAFHQLNYQMVKDVLLLPMATGMALTMVFLTLAEKYPDKKFVLWPRIDQKTCLKSIITANLTPIVIDQQLNSDSLSTNTTSLQQTILQLNPNNILCLVSTTSCFAPRIPDNLLTTSQLAKKYGLYHIVNNAYGVWCSKIAHQIKKSFQEGQCTAVVQSMDKNFMVPVGGAIIFTQKQQLLKLISAKYPGRASSSPIVDLFLTLLSMGKNNINQLKKQRKQLYKYMLETATQFANKHGFRILKTQANTISIAMHLCGLEVQKITQLGSILYSKKVMGHRIVSQSKNITKIGGIEFSNYGSHHDKYPYLPYITFACAVGTLKGQIDTFFERFEQAIKELLKKQNKKNKMKKEQQLISSTISVGKQQKNEENVVVGGGELPKQIHEIINCQQQKCENIQCNQDKKCEEDKKYEQQKDSKQS